MLGFLSLLTLLLSPICYHMITPIFILQTMTPQTMVRKALNNIQIWNSPKIIKSNKKDFISIITFSQLKRNTESATSPSTCNPNVSKGIIGYSCASLYKFLLHLSNKDLYYKVSQTRITQNGMTFSMEKQKLSCPLRFFT